MDSTPVCLVTGANTGIGRVTALELARDGMHVFVACRSAQRTQPVVEDIRQQTGNPKVEFLPLDLGDFASVRACAQQFLARGLPLHLLINNAGLAGKRGLTRSGFEIAFGTNHLGHFLLTELLRPKLVESAPARIVIVASLAHRRVSGIDFARVQRKTSSLTGVPEYGVSKLANILHAAQLARRLEGTGVTVYSLHPGVIASDIWRQVPWPFRALMRVRMLTVEQGAQTTLHCARSPELADHSGRYYSDCRETETTAVAQDQALQRELWDHSAGWTQSEHA